MSRCRWDPEARVYTRDDQPCTVDEYGDPTHHCKTRRSCGQHIGPEELTCPLCISRVRNDLRGILDNAALIPVEAIARGNLNAEAVNLAGPHAHPVLEWWRRINAAMANTSMVTTIGDTEPEDPVLLPQKWQAMLAEDFDHPLPDKTTLSGAVAYLGRHLARIAQDPEQDFRLLASEMRWCRAQLEAVLRNSRTPERGAPCPACATEHPDAPAPRLTRRYGHWCEAPDCEKLHYDDDSADEWRCWRGHTWTEHDYRLWVADWYQDVTRREPAASE